VLRVEQQRKIKLEKSINDIRQIRGGRAASNQHLSRSIIIHHNKMQTLMQSVGRYNELLHNEEEDTAAFIGEQINEEMSDLGDDEQDNRCNTMQYSNIKGGFEKRGD
jgi:hypothetical protein